PCRAPNSTESGPPLWHKCGGIPQKPWPNPQVCANPKVKADHSEASPTRMGDGVSSSPSVPNHSPRPQQYSDPSCFSAQVWSLATPTSSQSESLPTWEGRKVSSDLISPSCCCRPSPQQK